MAAGADDEWGPRASLRSSRPARRDSPAGLARFGPPRPPAPRTGPDRRGETRSRSWPGPAPAGPGRSGKEPPAGRSPERSHALGFDTNHSRDGLRTSRCHRSASPEPVEFETCSTHTARRGLAPRRCNPALRDSGAHCGPPPCPFPNEVGARKREGLGSQDARPLYRDGGLASPSRRGETRRPALSRRPALTRGRALTRRASWPGAIRGSRLRRRGRHVASGRSRETLDRHCQLPMRRAGSSCRGSGYLRCGRSDGEAGCGLEMSFADTEAMAQARTGRAPK